jgi:hypothetical protein
MTAPCGLDCFNCVGYLANENDEIRKMVSKRTGVPSDRAFCKGCRDEYGICPLLNMKEPCNVYKCIHHKALSFCYECEEFPCDYLHPYADRATEVPHNIKVFNLVLMKKMGVERWAKEKAKSVRDTYFKGKWNI